MEKRLVYTTTGLRITPYEEGQVKALEKHTSTYDKIYHRWNSLNGFYNDKLSIFATYKINPGMICKMFPDYTKTYVPAIKPGIVPQYNLTVSLNKYQTEIMDRLSSLPTMKNEVFVNSPTASGKTVLATAYAAMMHTPTIVVCFSSKILEQWQDTFACKTDIPIDSMMKIVTGRQMYDMYTGEYDVSRMSVFFVTTSLLDRFGTDYGYEYLQPLFERLHIGLKIIDEAHCRLATITRLNAYTSVNKTLYLSADFNQANSRKLRLFMDMLKYAEVIKLSNESMKELSHITVVNSIFYSHPSMKDKLNIVSGAYKWSNLKYTRYQFTNGIFIKAFDDIIDKILQYDEDLTDSGYKILVLVQLIEEIDILVNRLHKRHKEVSTSGYYAKDDSEDQTKATHSKIIVSTYKAFSTGIDITKPEIRHVISTCPVDVVTSNQAAGRCRPIKGLTSYFWMMLDYDFEHCVYNAQKVNKYLLDNKAQKVDTLKLNER